MEKFTTLVVGQRQVGREEVFKILLLKTFYGVRYWHVLIIGISEFE